MKRNDIIILVLLFGLLIGWRYIDSNLVKKHFFKDQPRPAAAADAATPPATGELAAPSAPVAPQAETAAATPATEAAVAAASTPVAEASKEEPETAPEQTATLSNGELNVVFTSRGAAIKEVTIKNYRSTLSLSSGPVVLDFSSAPALAYERLPGLDGERNFAMTVDSANNLVQFTRDNAQGLRLVRTIQLGQGYLLNVTDTFSNESDAPAPIEPFSLRTGPMRREPGHRDSVGFVYLGVDTLSPGGEGVQHWSSKIASFFKQEQKEKNLPKLPVSISHSPIERPVDWVSAKNKYFAQIVTPEDGSDGAVIHATRDVSAREKSDPDFAPKMTPIEEVSASLLNGATIVPARQSLTPRHLEYYVGPMKYDVLHKMSLHRVDVMELGMWRPIGKVLLVVMNFIHDHLWPHNYGLAIILLTIIVRMVFWPITHKSTESMKRMAEVQPLVTEIRAKHKDNPQKMQQEIMALYKERKINPLGGCLPMLIQIPIFIALFMVLRSAIELRFASFLWIKDLSEPENLFAGALGFPLNILPILMALTMFFQQKLTPTAGDPAQAKMMRVMMPGMMLFFLYNYASGLALYWTTQNLLMIIQQLVMQYKKKRAAAA